MNPKDRDYIALLQKKDLRNRYSLYSGSRDDDIKKYGFFVTDHAIVRFLERVVQEIDENYRYKGDSIISSLIIVDKIKNWNKNRERWIDFSTYVLVVKNQTISEIWTKKND